ncbi:uncharacterized protein LOC141664672 [Apium graveolens]|uniref:uncharacterized protein LOC141664672 n=1 Tax=Apium graveolens TaxID=4045 RepID=UPI003D79F40A
MPHHNLPHYGSEFNVVAGDIVAWMSYAHFHKVEEDLDSDVDWDSDGDHDISAEDWVARFFGFSRVPVLCYDIVEYQHSDMVMRQFGLRQGIPRSLVTMTEYRMPMIPFSPYDWRYMLIDTSILPEYQQEFGRIAPMFVKQYYRFIQTVRGPAYTASLF